MNSTWVPRGATSHGVAPNLGALVYVVICGATIVTLMDQEISQGLFMHKFAKCVAVKIKVTLQL